jgi:amino-acid N-acetyltransferase
VSEGHEFRVSTADDEPALRALLASASLPVDDVSADRQEFVLAHSGGRLVGCVGLEACGEVGLLRSFAVVPALRRQGLGAALFERIVARALLRGVKTAYVLTTSAERFCLAHGFERIARAEVPAPIAATEQFRALCPATAACFRRRLAVAAVHFPGDVLRLRPDVPGAAMWGVALERAMLTYFELQPHARFERHRHPSEQITMVLEGELFFEVEGGAEVRVRAGEVIALPANVPHAAWTREQPARAVDAWSPPRADLVRS